MNAEKWFHHLAGVLALGLLSTACHKAGPADFSMLENELSDNQARLVKARLIASDLRASLQASVVKSDELQATLATLKQEAASLLTQQEEVAQAMQDWKSTYQSQMRFRSQGMTVPSMIVRGVEYRNVVLDQISGPEVTFSHSKGRAKAAYVDLPDELHDKFGSLTDVMAASSAAQSGALTSQMPPMVRPDNWDTDYKKLQEEALEAARRAAMPTSVSPFKTPVMSIGKPKPHQPKAPRSSSKGKKGQ